MTPSPTTPNCELPAAIAPILPLTPRAAANESPQRLLHGRDDARDVEAVVLEDRLGRRRGAELVDPDHGPLRADPLRPPERRARLDRNAGAAARRQDRLAIGRLLRGERLPARHRDHARPDPLLLERVTRLHRELHLRAARDQDRLEPPLRVLKHVGPLLESARGADLGAVEGRELLARKDDRGRAVLAREGVAPRLRGLVR